jgi:RimJ/RimL family protein N-acetyltransferase
MPEIPELTGRLSDGAVELRPIAEWDIPEILIAHQDDPQLSGRLGLDRPPTGAQLGAEVERADAQRATGASLALTIVEPGGEDCIGRVQTQMIDWDGSSAELVGWVAPGYRGRGITARGLALAAAWLTDACGLQHVRVQAISDGAGDDLPPDPGGRQLQR